MKVREGFVSNSSSSSFLLAIRKGHGVKEILEGASPIAKALAGPAVDFLAGRALRSLEEEWISHTNYYSGGDDEEAEYALELKDDMLSLIDGEDPEEWEFCWGFASDDSYYNTGELAICFTSIECDEGNVRLWTQGGY